MRFYPETKIAAGLLVAFLFVTAGTGLACYNSFKAVQTGKVAASGLELLGALESLLQVLRHTTESSISYLRSGKAIDLEVFQRESSRINAHLQFIKTLGATDKRRYVQITSLETLIRTLMNRTNELVRKRQFSSEPIDMPENTKRLNQAALELIRGRILYIQAEEKELVKRGLATYEEDTRHLFEAYAFLGILVALFFFGLTKTLLRYIKTTRRAAEAEKRVTNEIVEHAPVGIMILDDKTKVVSVNPTFVSLLGAHGPGELLGKRVIEVAPAVLVEAVEELMNLSSFTQPSSDDDVNLSVHSKDRRVMGSKHWDISVWPIYENVTLKGVIIQAFDVTDKVIMHHQRQLLFNTFAHDLKNPLVGNQYLVKALLTGSSLSEADRLKLLDQIDKGNQDVLKMVKNILEISKIYENVQLLKSEPFDVAALMSKCVEEMRVQGEHRSVKLECFVPSEPLTIKSDQTAIHHLALNLLENAIKFSEAGQTVSLTLAEKDDMISLSVKDDGPGISEEDQKRIFTGIWQGEVGRRAPGGTGIGLYLCNQIAEVLGGKISLKSEVNRGTTFTVEVPRGIELSVRSEQTEPGEKASHTIARVDKSPA